jgi:hypothetical protein
VQQVGVEVVEAEAGEAALAGGDGAARRGVVRIDLADDEHVVARQRPARSASASAAPTTSSAPPSPYISAVSIDAPARLERAADGRDLAPAGARVLAHAPGAEPSDESCTLPGNVTMKESRDRVQDGDHPMTTMFAVGRGDLRRTQWRETPPAALRPGEARLRVDLFALTANNVTYGAFGEAMHYWDFFPTGDAETGCIPVWGFATVSESLVDGVDVGERFYGYWPMADEVVSRRCESSPRASSTARRIVASWPRSTTATCAAAAIRCIAPRRVAAARCCSRSSSPRS